MVSFAQQGGADARDVRAIRRAVLPHREELRSHGRGDDGRAPCPRCPGGRSGRRARGCAPPGCRVRGSASRSAPAWWRADQADDRELARERRGRDREVERVLVRHDEDEAVGGERRRSRPPDRDANRRRVRRDVRRKGVLAVSIQRTANGSGASASTSARPTWPAPKRDGRAAHRPWVSRHLIRRVVAQAAEARPADAAPCPSRRPSHCGTRVLDEGLDAPAPSRSRGRGPAHPRVAGRRSRSGPSRARRSTGRDRARAPDRRTAPARAPRASASRAMPSMPFELAAADGAVEGAVRAHDHARAGLARGGALHVVHGDEGRRAVAATISARRRQTITAWASRARPRRRAGSPPASRARRGGTGCAGRAHGSRRRWRRTRCSRASAAARPRPWSDRSCPRGSRSG